MSHGSCGVGQHKRKEGKHPKSKVRWQKKHNESGAWKVHDVAKLIPVVAKHISSKENVVAKHISVKSQCCCQTYSWGTGWRWCIGCLKLQVSFCKRATNRRALLRKETYIDKASYGSLPPCSHLAAKHACWCQINISLSVPGICLWSPCCCQTYTGCEDS